MLDRLDAGGHVSDAADGQYLHAHVVADHGFRHGAHAHGIGSHPRKGANFSRRFIARAHKAHVNALLVGNAQFIGGLLGKVPQFQTVRFGHVREAGAEALIVGANEGVRAHHVDEVGNEHQGARRKLPVDAAAGVGQHHLFHAQQLEHIERVADFLHGVALIEMEAAFHGVDFRVPQLASQQCAFVSCHRGYREVGDILVGQFFRVRKVRGQLAKAGAQHHRDLRALFRVRLDIFRTFQCLFIKMFHTVLSFSQKIRYTLWVQYIGFFRPMQDALHRVLLKTKEQILHITSVLYLLLGSPNVLSLADVPPKQLISFPDILRQTFQSLVPQFLRHPVKSFGNAAGDAGKGVAVAAQRDRIAKCILKTDAFQKSNDCFRHSFLTGLHMMIGRPNFHRRYGSGHNRRSAPHIV